MLSYTCCAYTIEQQQRKMNRVSLKQKYWRTCSKTHILFSYIQSIVLQRKAPCSYGQAPAPRAGRFRSWPIHFLQQSMSDPSGPKDRKSQRKTFTNVCRTYTIFFHSHRLLQSWVVSLRKNDNNVRAQSITGFSTRALCCYMYTLRLFQSLARWNLARPIYSKESSPPRSTYYLFYYNSSVQPLDLLPTMTNFLSAMKFAQNLNSEWCTLDSHVSVTRVTESFLWLASFQTSISILLENS